MQKSVIANLEKNELQHLVDSSSSLCQILVKLGLSSNGSSSYTNLRQRLINLGIDVSSMRHKPLSKSERNSDVEFFVEKSTVARRAIKNRLIKEKIIAYECSVCKNDGKWCDKILVLHLDHINGINDDNRIENLRFLCPNCHSQTQTYAGKNIKHKDSLTATALARKRKNLPVSCACGNPLSLKASVCKHCNKVKQVKKFNATREELHQLYHVEKKTMLELGKLFGVSDNAVKKRMIKYGLQVGRKS